MYVPTYIRTWICTCKTNPAENQAMYIFLHTFSHSPRFYHYDRAHIVPLTSFAYFDTLARRDIDFNPHGNPVSLYVNGQRFMQIRCHAQVSGYVVVSLAVDGGSHAHFLSSTFWYYHFSCVPKTLACTINFVMDQVSSF